MSLIRTATTPFPHPYYVVYYEVGLLGYYEDYYKGSYLRSRRWVYGCSL